MRDSFGWVLMGLGFFYAPFASAGTVSLGKLEFQVETNVKLFRFKGEAGLGSASLERSGDQLKSLELKFPVETLKTGMSLRDKHMRERVFTTADGKTPDVVFRASDVRCSGACSMNGTLSIRGETRPVVLTVQMRDSNHAEGSTQIALSKFGIEAPSQAGVRVLDQVDVRFGVELK